MYEMSKWRVSETKTKKFLWSSEVGQYEETMTNEQSQNGGDSKSIKSRAPKEV